MPEHATRAVVIAIRWPTEEEEEEEIGQVRARRVAVAPPVAAQNDGPDLAPTTVSTVVSRTTKRKSVHSASTYHYWLWEVVDTNPAKTTNETRIQSSL